MWVGRSSASPMVSPRPSTLSSCAEAGVLEEHPPGERQPVAVDAAAGDADDAVAGPDVRAEVDGVEVDAADGGGREVEARAGRSPPDHVPHLGDLAAGDGDAGQPRALGEARAEGLEHRRLGPLHGDVVHQRDRPRADADEVVDVHRHAVDADRVVAAGHLRDQRLGADPVGADGDSDAAEIHDAREVAEPRPERAGAGVAGGPGGADMADQAGEPCIYRIGVDAGAVIVQRWTLRRGCHALSLLRLPAAGTSLAHRPAAGKALARPPLWIGVGPPHPVLAGRRGRKVAQPSN